MILKTFRERLRDTSPKSLRLMGIGSIAIGIQSFILVFALVSFGQATAINIVYSSRAIFGVLLVMYLGKRLGNHESTTAGAKVMRSRLAGSLLLCGAIALVFI